MLQLETQAGENVSGSFKIWVEDAKRSQRHGCYGLSLHDFGRRCFSGEKRKR